MKAFYQTMTNSKQDSKRRIHPTTVQRTRHLRRSQTPIEIKLWSRLRNKQLDGYRFRRQHPIGNFIVDFCCINTGVIVEVDGDSHAMNGKYDTSRTEWLETKGYTVLRYSNREVLYHLDAVLASILDACHHNDETL